MTRPIIGRVEPEQRRSSGAPSPTQAGREAGTAREPGIARIAVDLLGGDQAPAVVVDGALRAAQADPALQLLLVGPVEAADAVRHALAPNDRHRIFAIPAPSGSPSPSRAPRAGSDRADRDRAPRAGSDRAPRADRDRDRAPHAGSDRAPRADRDRDRAPHAGSDRAPRADRDRDRAPHADSDRDRAPHADSDRARRPDRDPTRASRDGGTADSDCAGRDPSSIECGVRTAVLAVAQGHADAVVSAGNTGATVTSAALSLGRWPGVRRPALTAVLPTSAGRLVLLDVGATVDPDEAALAMHARLGAAYAAVVHKIAAPRVGLLTIGTERGKGDRLRRAAPAVLAALGYPAGGRYAGLVEGDDVVTGAGADVVVTDGFSGNVLLKGLETAYALLGAPHPGEVPPRAALLLGVGGTVVVCHGAAAGSDIAAGIGFAASLHRQNAVSAIAGLVADRAEDRTSPDPQNARGA